MIEETQRRFVDFKICSFDKGFHSPYNQKELANLLDKVLFDGKYGFSQNCLYFTLSFPIRRKFRLKFLVENPNQEFSFGHYL
jgi:hypothetical protein